MLYLYSFDYLCYFCKYFFFLLIVQIKSNQNKRSATIKIFSFLPLILTYSSKSSTKSYQKHLIKTKYAWPTHDSFAADTICYWGYVALMTNTNSYCYPSNTSVSSSTILYVPLIHSLVVTSKPFIKGSYHLKSFIQSSPTHTVPEFNAQASSSPIRQTHLIYLSWSHSATPHIPSWSNPDKHWYIDCQ